MSSRSIPSLRAVAQRGGSLARVLVAAGVACVLIGTVYGLWSGTHKEGVRQDVPRFTPDQLKAKAEQGDAEAQRNLGQLFSRGQGVAQNYKEAAKWYRQAADHGDAAAQNALGELCEAGQGVAHDDAAAAGWYRKAADQGLPAAQYNLAALYVMGSGVPLNGAEAAKWYRKAAEGGLALAQFNMGMRCYEAKDVPTDYIESFKWLSLAGQQGLADALHKSNELKSKMTNEQIAEAKRRIKAFVPKKSV